RRSTAGLAAGSRSAVGRADAQLRFGRGLCRHAADRQAPGRIGHQGDAVRLPEGAQRRRDRGTLRIPAESATGRLAGDQPSAFCTARLAITPTRWARYSAEAWMSLFIMPGSVLMPFRASALKDFDSAASISLWRNTQGAAPVTATRMPPAVSATMTPTMA